MIKRALSIFFVLSIFMNVSVLAQTDNKIQEAEKLSAKEIRKQNRLKRKQQKKDSLAEVTQLVIPAVDQKGIPKNPSAQASKPLQELLNEDTGAVTVQNQLLKDSTLTTQLKTLDQINKPNTVANENLDLTSVKVVADFDKGLKDHPSLEQLDERWQQELFNSDLFDTIYQTVQNQQYSKIPYFPNLPTETLKERLVELNARTPFNVEYNPSLESVIKNYLKNRHESLERLMALSDYYFPLFEQVLDKYDLPLEIKYLAIVESALKPRAKSRVGATGLWQFMFGTGKEYDLHVSSYVDERMDPIKSTEASARYLAKLYKIFGDWDLALASYNSGPGNVSKAIRRSGGYTNYWNIRPYLPRETAGYVPAFLATMYIFEYADKHDFKVKRPEYTYFETDTVRVKQQISLDQVAEVMDVKIEALQFLNPQYKLDIIPHIKQKDYTLRLPLRKVGTFVTNENAIYAKAKEDFDKREKPLPQLVDVNQKIRYRVRSGDYLGLIARKFGVRVSKIKQWNGLRNNNIRVGKYLTIYPRKVNNYIASKKASVEAKSAAKTGNVYVVKSGDSLWSISRKYAGVSVDNLKKWNTIRGNSLKPGMRLKVSAN